YRAPVQAEAWGLKDAFKSLRVSDPAKYLPLLHHQDSAIRRATLDVLADLGETAGPYLAAVLPLLGDPSDTVVYGALSVLRAIGSTAYPMLRAMRRDPAPSRRQALRALAEVGGWG